MPQNLPSAIILYGALGLTVFVGLCILIRAIRNRLTPVKKVSATVIEKHKVESFSKYAGNGKQVKYVIVFSVDGKKKSFYVSSFSYGGYRLKEKGTLTYQGDRLISFE